MRLLEEHLAQAEKAKHSCLVCRHFHYTDHGTVIVCGKRIGVVPVLVDGWTSSNYKTSCTRAARCEFFDDMRK